MQLSAVDCNLLANDPTIPAVILAAGQGTRMNAGVPKPAVQLLGKPMVVRVIETMQNAGISRIIVVVGHRAEDVRAAINTDVEYVVQEQQMGTGDAFRSAQETLTDYRGPVVVAYADTPLLRQEDIICLLKRHRETKAAATIITAIDPNPGSPGRIIRGEDGRVRCIVEVRDATPEQLAINELNIGVYCFSAPLIFDILAGIRNDNAQRQYYLTDAIGLLTQRGKQVETVALRCVYSGLGVDTPGDLARAEKLMASDPTLE